MTQNVNLEVFSGRVIAVTPLAFLVRLDDPDVELWVPKSLCEGLDDTIVGDVASSDFEVPEWWATQQGISP
jgi:hypothetical protein